MTIRELYKWAEENGALDMDVEVRDDFGDYGPEPDPYFENFTTYEVVRL